MSKIELLTGMSARVRAQIATALRTHSYERNGAGRIQIANSTLSIGGAMKVRDYRDNSIEIADVDANTLLTQGLAHMFNNWFVPTGGFAQITQWYFAPFSGNHTPDETITAATFPGAATEFTDYTASTRLPIVIATATTTAATGNAGDEALMTCSTGGPYNVYGAYIVSVSTKSNTGGKAAAGIRLDNPKLGMTGGDKLGFEYVVTADNAA